MAAHFGLRGKSVATLLLACLLALIPAVLIGWKAVDEVRRHFATAYAEQYTLLQMQQAMAPVSRELALSRRFANSVVTREWLQAPDDPHKRARFFAEAEGFRQQFAGNVYFIVDHASGDYYINDGDRFDEHASVEPAPRYRLHSDEPNHGWYFDTMSSTATFRIDISADRGFERAMIWVRVKVRDGDEVLGLVGGGLDLGDFIDRFISVSAPGLTPMIVDPRGILQAHPDRARIALNSGSVSSDTASSQHIQSLISDDQQQEAVRRAMHDSMRRPGEIVALDVNIEGQPRLLSVGYIPELQWLLITALDIQAAPLLDSRWFWPLATALVLILAMLMGAFAYATNRLILAPLSRLKLSAQAIANGDYSPRLPTERRDEIGELSQAFSHMAQQVERYTGDLESQVRERTQALESAHAEMTVTHKQLGDSIHYASIIQRAILPDTQLSLHFKRLHAALWRPRDTVGGDFYVFRATSHGYLLGVVDCAGHGVPGALMTMLAHAILDHAIAQEGIDDPAAVLNEIDRKTRQMLPKEQLPSSIATNMDIGLVWIDATFQNLTYAGAKLDLYASDGERLSCLKGHKRPLGHRRPAHYENQHAPLHPGWSYYLCSDGFLDQAGGEQGFGFGTRRFEALIKAQASAPLETQPGTFERTLDDYRGSLPQRDDVTLLIFRLPDDGLDSAHSLEHRQNNLHDHTHRDIPTEETPWTY